MKKIFIEVDNTNLVLGGKYGDIVYKDNSQGPIITTVQEKGVYIISDNEHCVCTGAYIDCKDHFYSVDLFVLDESDKNTFWVPAKVLTDNFCNRGNVYDRFKNK